MERGYGESEVRPEAETNNWKEMHALNLKVRNIKR